MTGARIFDRLASDLIDGRVVFVQDNWIAAFGEPIDAPEGATIIDIEVITKIEVGYGNAVNQ